MRKLLFSFTPSKVVLLALGLLALLWVLAPLPVVRAQGAHRRGTIVRNDGQVISVQAFPVHFASAKRPTLQPPKSPSVATQNLPPLVFKSPYSVIGDDERVQVQDTTAYPNGAIVNLQITFPFGSGSCTGWMIGTHTVATAAHCVYLGELGGWATAITVIPGRNGSTAPFGSYLATHWYAKKNWTVNEKPKLDFGVLNIGTDIAPLVGTFGFAYNNLNTFWQGYPVTVRGYPAEKTAGTMWTMDGTIAKITKARFFYEIDTSPGESGAPLYGTWGTDCDPCGFGIHTYAVTGNWTLNSASRITPQVFNFFNTVIAQP